MRSVEIDREKLQGLLTIVPTLGILFVAVFVPIVFAIWGSFHSIHPLDPVWDWVGLENYSTILDDPEFYAALRNGVVYTVGSVSLQLVLGVSVALLLNSVKSRALTALTLGIYLIPSAVITLVAKNMVQEPTGVIYMFLREYGFVSQGFNFWADGTVAMTMVVLIGSYKFSIFVTLMVLARLQSIPAAYYESARISGASTLQIFRDITWPAISGVVAIVVLLRGIWMFNNFDVIWILTAGGPGESTTTLPILAYKTMFQDLAYGQSSAIAVLMFGLLMIGGFFYFKFFSPEKQVGGS